MTSITICKNDFKSLGEYYQAYRQAVQHYDCKTPVDDGQGGRGWMFFETKEESKIWKNLPQTRTKFILKSLYYSGCTDQASKLLTHKGKRKFRVNNH